MSKGEKDLRKQFPKLDSKCAQILPILIIRGELRFKELKKALVEFGIEMPETTLLMHLNHLIKYKLVSKKIISVKNVTYRPNMEKLEELQLKVNEVEKLVKEWIEAKETFLDMSIEDQILNILEKALVFRLGALKQWIIFAKYGKFEDRLMAELFESDFLRVHEKLLIKKCLEDEKYMEKVLEQIEEELRRVLR